MTPANRDLYLARREQTQSALTEAKRALPELERAHREAVAARHAAQDKLLDIQGDVARFRNRSSALLQLLRERDQEHEEAKRTEASAQRAVKKTREQIAGLEVDTAQLSELLADAEIREEAA